MRALLCIAGVSWLALAVASAGCQQGDAASIEAATHATADPDGGSATGAQANDDGGHAPATATADGGGHDGGAAASCTCPSGQACNVTGACVPCTKACGANGACVVGWESGPHCQCAPGYYESLSGCVPAAGSACDGVSCSGHGTCFAGPPLFSPECRCEGDFVSYGLACAPLHALRCIDADGSLKDKGTIRCNAANTAFEVCRDGNKDGTVEWVASGMPSCAAGATCTQCLGAKCDNGDGSGGQACPTGTVCMGMVHEMPVYQCAPSCDCSNCGTCDPGQFSGYQRACGSTANSFENPTKACASPCPHAGDGCLPYGQLAFCFPNEGCASAAPK
jgi:hypothetical protein